MKLTNLKNLVVRLVLSVFMGTNFLNVFAYDKGNNSNNQQSKLDRLKSFKDKMKFKDLKQTIKENNQTRADKKLNAIKRSINNNGKYKLLINSNENVDAISNFFLTYDSNVKVKKVGNNIYSVRINKNSDLYSQLFSGVSADSIPEKLFDKYDVLMPQALQSSELSLAGEQTGNLWRTDKIGLNSYLANLSGNTNKVKVGIIDSGIYKDHIDFKDNVDNTLGYDFLENDNIPQDDNGHGTHISGIIGGELNSQGVYGVNPNNIDIVPLKILDKDGIGSSYDLIDAINYAKDNGIKIINISLGGYADPSTSPICAAITDAKNIGVLTVAAAGNTNEDTKNIVPAGCSDAITVGATDQSGSKTNFSNYGNNVKISAPGSDIYSTWNDGNYKTLSGTSQSSAIVAGALSLLLAQDSSLDYNGLVNKLNANTQNGVLSLGANNTNITIPEITGDQVTGNETVLSGFLDDLISLPINTGSNLSGSLYSGYNLTGGLLSGGMYSGETKLSTGLYYSGMFYYSGNWYGNGYYNTGMIFPQKILDKYHVEVLSGDVKPNINNKNNGLLKAMSVPTNGLVGQWKLDGNTNDTSGLGNNGTPYNMTRMSDTVNGKQKTVGKFNGSSSFVLLPGGYHPLNTDTFTTSFRLYLDQSVNRRTILFGEGNHSRDMCNRVMLDPSAYFFYQARRNYNTTQNIYSVTPLQPGRRYHLAVVRDGSSISFYINNVLNYSSTIGISYYGDHAFTIGGGLDEINGATMDFLNGKMSDARIYNRALSQSEITQLYNEGTETNLAPSVTPNLTQPNIPQANMCYDNKSLGTDNANNTQNQSLTQSQVDTQSQADPVTLANGEFTYNNTLMHTVSQGMNFDFDVSYKSQMYYDGPVGVNFDHSYNIFLTGNSDGSVTFYKGKLGVFNFFASGTEYTYNDGLRGKLVKDANNRYKILFDDGRIYMFGDNMKIANMYDRYSNQMSFQYDTGSKLTQITDTNGRTYNLTYYDTDRLQRVTDFNGRYVEFTYYGSGDTDGALYDLKQIKIHNATNSEKTIGFTYSTQHDSNKLGHNILTLTDSKGGLYVTNMYDNYDRVTSQQYGNGIVYYNYTLNSDGTKIVKNSVTNRNATVVDYTYDDNMNNIQKDIHTDSGIVTYKYEYDSNGRLIKEIKPRGNGTTYKYDDKGNIIEKRLKSDITASDDDTNDIVTKNTYDANYNVVTQQINPDGTHIDYTLDGSGNVLSQKISSVQDFDGNAYDIITNYQYNNVGQLTQKTDPQGIVTNFVYSGANLIKTIKGTGDNAIENDYNYDAYSNLVSQTDGEGKTKTMTYDDFNQMNSVTSAQGITSNIQYDANGNKTYEETVLTGGSKAKIYYEYDILDKLTKKTVNIDDTNQIQETYSYDSNGNIIVKILANSGHVWYGYNKFDKLSDVTTQIDPNDSSKNITLTYTYDNNTNLVKKTDGRGRDTIYQYDMYDRLIKTTDANGSYSTNTYDKNGNIVSQSFYSSQGTLLAKIDTTYDQVGQIIQKTNYKLEDNSVITTKTKYNKDGKIIENYDAKGNKITNTYDTLGRLATTTDSLGNSVNYTYDKRDLVIQKDTIGGDNKTLTIKYAYDNDGRLITQTDNTNNVSTNTYDNLNNIIQQTDENGNLVLYNYDYVGRLLQKTENLIASGNNQQKITKYEYNNIGKVTKLTDANNNATTYEYDLSGRLLKESYADGKQVSYTYDKNDNLLTKTDPNGTIARNVYDNLNRVIEKNITLGTGVEGITGENYIYDQLGRLTNANDSSGNQLSFQYDSLGQLISETNSDQTISYVYDINGNLTSKNYGSGQNTTYAYDNLDRLIQIQNNGSTVASYTYTGNDLLNENIGNAINKTYAYDNMDRWSQVSNAMSGSSIGYNYQYDNIGNITNDGEKSYQYDSLYRLTQSNYLSGINSYTYDLMGNRTISTQNNTNYTYTTNNLNQYTQINSGDIQYDANGNEIQNQGKQYTYDYKNRLVEAKDMSGNTLVKYEYDVLGRRIKKITPTKTTTYIYSNNDILEENTIENGKTSEKTYINGLGTDDVIGYTLSGDVLNGNLAGEYNFCENRVNAYSGEFTTYGWTGIVDRCQRVMQNAYTSGTNTVYYVKNNLGSIIALVDNQGNKLVEYAYDEFGNAYVKDGSGNKIELDNRTGNNYNNTRLYTSREYDSEVKLYYYRARYYDANLGRFISEDPIGTKDDVNLYSYVGNNPLNAVDPSGKTKILLSTGEFKINADGVVSRFVNGHRQVQNDVNFEKGMSLSDRSKFYSLFLKIKPRYTPEEQELINAAIMGSVFGGEVLMEEGFSSFTAFKRYFGTAGEGNEWHHIVGQFYENIEKFGAKYIHNRENLIRLPKELHNKITGYYNSAGIRDYVKSLSFEEQYKYGIDVIKKFGGGKYLK